MYVMYYAFLAPFVALPLYAVETLNLILAQYFIKYLSCLKENSIRKLKCLCGQNLRKSSRQIKPKVTLTPCSAAEHANMVDICTSSEHVSDCFDRYLHNSIGPTFSYLELTITTNATSISHHISSDVKYRPKLSQLLA